VRSPVTGSRSFRTVVAVIVILAAVAVLRVATRKTGARARRLGSIVRVEVTSRDTVTYALQTTGDVLAIQSASIASKVSGTLDRVRANIGDKVQAGQSLALVDTTELALAAAQAAATFATARSAYERARQLAADSLVSSQDFDDAEAAMKVAEANYRAAETRLGYAKVTAPFSGIVTARLLDAGALVSNGTELFTLADFDTVRVMVNVMERDVPLVAVGTPAQVVADALPSDTFVGRVGRTSNAVDPATRTMQVEVFVPNAQHNLKPGMYATVNLSLFMHPDIVTVPLASVLRVAADTFVYLVRRDTARKTKVRTGIEQGARVEIVSGLTDGETLITTGQQYVRDAAPVTVEGRGQRTK
jgi:membrane fusion protein (multidrug efflux system)